MHSNNLSVTCTCFTKRDNPASFDKAGSHKFVSGEFYLVEQSFFSIIYGRKCY